MKFSTVLSLGIPMAFAFKNDGAHLARQPIPTAAPEPFRIDAMLNKRVVGSDTCGWVDGDPVDSVTCNPGYQCAHNPFYSAFGCCSGALSTCVLPTVCFDSTYAVSVASRADVFTHLCLDSEAPKCNSYVFPGGYTGFGCGVVESLAFVSTQISGAQAGGVTSAFSFAGTVASAAATATSDAGAGAAQTSPAASSTSPSSSSGGGSGGGGGISTGAIVGIAIAGAVVAVTAIAVIGFICYKRSKRSSGALQQQQQPMYTGYPPGPSNMSQGQHTSYMGPQSPGGPGAAGASHVGSGVSQGSHPMTQANMNNMLNGQQQPQNEWAFASKPVQQSQTAAAENDGINVTEIMPEEAVDEQQQQHQQHQHHQAVQGQFVEHPGSPSPVHHAGSPGPIQHPGSPGSPSTTAYYSSTHPSQYGQQQKPDDVMSAMAPTAVAPTIFSHNVQNV